ncbi:Arm DNA-binding domain-containing protein [Aeromonas sp. 600584]|uniref:Arm DNA-binding domain-containing protein n=1 Tax=Aeromonas sp. 600584 TaxID=2712030 RepID=UPI003BA2795A
MGRVAPGVLAIKTRGIEVHGKKLRLNFTYKGVRCREVLHLPITKANIKFAEKKLASIQYEIATNTFNYAKHFPDSKAISRFERVQENPTLWEAYEKYWALHGPSLKPTTQASYPFSLKTCIKILGPDRKLASLLPLDLQMLRNTLNTTYKPRTVNLCMARFRQMLAWCERNGFGKEGSTLSGQFQYVPVGKGSSADPFEFDEFQRLLKACKDQQQRNIITLAVYTGLRTGELRALAWEDIDLQQGQMLIRRNADEAATYFKLPKTGDTRIVDLQPPVIDALRSQKQLTFMMPAYEVKVDVDDGWETFLLRPVFCPSDPAHREPVEKFYSTTAISKMWRRMIRVSGVRYRRFYQLRHTYASWNLTSHGNLAYIASQMGHKNLEMLQRVYGKWLDSASKPEAQRIWEQMQSKGLFAPTTPQAIISKA